MSSTSTIAGVHALMVPSTSLVTNIYDDTGPYHFTQNASVCIRVRVCIQARSLGLSSPGSLFCSDPVSPVTQDAPQHSSARTCLFAPQVYERNSTLASMLTLQWREKGYRVWLKFPVTQMKLFVLESRHSSLPFQRLFNRLPICSRVLRETKNRVEDKQANKGFWIQYSCLPVTSAVFRVVGKLLEMCSYSEHTTYSTRKNKLRKKTVVYF